MLDTKQFSQDLEALVTKSKNIRNAKEGIEAVIHHAYFILSTGQLQMFARPFGKVACLKDLTSVAVFTRSEEEFDLLTTATNSLLAIYASNEPFTDVLTELYGQYLGYDKGQHMTPSDLSALLVELSLAGIKEQMNGENAIVIGDPTGCGTGAMILASIKHIYEKHGKEFLGYCDFVGVELDRTLAMATVVQVEFGSIMHNIHFNKFEVFNANCITEYTNNETLLYRVVPNQLRYRRVKSEPLAKAA